LINKSYTFIIFNIIEIKSPAHASIQQNNSYIGAALNTSAVSSHTVQSNIPQEDFIASDTIVFKVDDMASIQNKGDGTEMQKTSSSSTSKGININVISQ
jgi:hypothetical protein